MNPVKSNTLGISEPLMRLIYEVMGRALTGVQGKDTFMPIFIVQKPDGTGPVILMANETVEEAIVYARLGVAVGNSLSYYALAYDGFFTDESVGIPRTKAVLVEAYEPSKQRGVRFMQRYTQASDQGPFSRMGNPIYGGELPLPTEAEYKPQVERYESQRKKSGDPSI